MLLLLYATIVDGGHDAAIYAPQSSSPFTNYLIYSV